MRERRVAVTGMSVINAAGNDLGAFWDAVSAGRSALGPITRFDTTGFPVQVAGEVSGFDAASLVNPRLLRKSDRFTHYALACSQRALEDAGLDLAAEDTSRVGVWFGNDTGGWDLAERGFRELYGDGAAMVNPYGATAWFPTAPQGFVTIQHGITGFSKSFVCDRASGGAALYFAWRAVRSGCNKVALAGGTESPITPLGLSCYFETGELSAARSAAGAYRPFDRSADGLVVGEGAVVLVLEELDRATRRGARIYGELAAGAMMSDPDPADGSGFEAAVRKALRVAGCGAGDVDLVLSEGAASPVSDRVEAAAYARLFPGPSRAAVTAPKVMFGHLFGASSGTDLVCGLMAMRTGRLPPTPTLADPLPVGGARYVTAPEAGEVARVLVTSRGREGVNVALVAIAPP